MKGFVRPKESLGGLDAGAAAELLAAASDVVLVIDRDGTIRDLAIQSDELAEALGVTDDWVGGSWASRVTIESRTKINALLRGSGPQVLKRLQLNHPTAGGADIPVLYAALPAGSAETIIAFGQDLRSVSTLQQRLVDAEQALERDYLRLRHMEARYRLLFEISSEAIVMLDAGTERPLELNSAARQLLGDVPKAVFSTPFYQLFDSETRGHVQSLLSVARAVGTGPPITARLSADGRELSAAATLFRQENAALFLVRLAPLANVAAAPLPDAKIKLLAAVERSPDGVAVTATDGRIVAVNTAMLDMMQLATPEQAQGRSLEQWLGRSTVDLKVLIANLRQPGTVRLFATRLQGEYGSITEVEISAVSIGKNSDTVYVFAIRNVGRRVAAGSRTGQELPRSVEQLTELIGRVPLKDLVRDATDLIERLCIEAALGLTGDNRASAAELLGLSRQSLYVKLRRYGLGDLDVDTDNQS